MTLGQIESYLVASREYLTRASDNMRAMGYCCGLGKLWAEQERLENIAWQARHGKDLGFAPIIPVIVLGGSLLAWLGTQVYTHYTEAKTQSDYLDCLKLYTQKYIDGGYSETEASDRASIVCQGKVPSEKEGALGLAKLAIYAGIGIAALYFIMKFIKD